MNSKKARTEEVVERLADIAEKHLNGLSPQERADRLHAFHQVVSNIGPGAKSGEPRGNPRNRRATLKRA